MEVGSRVAVGSWGRGRNRSFGGLDHGALVDDCGLGPLGDKELVFERESFVGVIVVLRNGGRQNRGKDKTFVEMWY